MQSSAHTRGRQRQPYDKQVAVAVWLARQNIPLPNGRHDEPFENSALGSPACCVSGLHPRLCG